MSKKAEIKSNFTCRSTKSNKQKNTFNKYGKYTKKHARIIEHNQLNRKNNLIKNRLIQYFIIVYF